ncbi:hypothetical protein EK21DRAFT_108664 [Setomelanomma holmii]|uniref:Uncharacterized protein n=1 Tax=Setomelanomma holmii TaxID=210430 RepID=A0A9P4HGK8_9PLEO|nr:hypothetical protein EK21DRAFT_108664 [Setomelanomma holmii]
MSSPTTPKATPAKPASPSFESSPDTPCPARSFNRFTTGDFGGRIANARNLRQQEAPPAPLPRTSVCGSEGGVILEGSLHSSLGPASSHKVRPIYGGFPGSYVGPYDSCGKTPGDQHLPNTSMSVQEWETKCAGLLASLKVAPTPGRRIAFGENPPVTFPEKGKEHVSAVDGKKVKREVPQGATDCLLFLGPFRIIRQTCAANPKHKGYVDLQAWLDSHMHESLHKVVKSDEVIREVVYTVSIPMIDSDWMFYNEVLAECFPEARELHFFLAPGYDHVDQFTAHHKFEKSGLFENEPDMLTKDTLTLEGQSKEEIVATMVKQHRLSLPRDYGRPKDFRPELVPEEMGGKMKGFQM